MSTDSSMSILFINTINHFNIYFYMLLINYPPSIMHYRTIFIGVICNKNMYPFIEMSHLICCLSICANKFIYLNTDHSLSILNLSILL